MGQASPSQPLDRPKVGRPPTFPDDERRHKILVAAESMFIAKGYAATSMDNVAHNCGMSKKTIYRYFAHKETLFSEILETALGSMPRFELKDDAAVVDGEAYLREVLQSLAELLLEPRRVALVRLVVAEAPLAPELAVSLNDKGRARAEAVLSEAVARLRKLGLLTGHAGDDLELLLLGSTVGDWLFNGLIGLSTPPTRQDIRLRIDRLFALVRTELFRPAPG